MATFFSVFHLRGLGHVDHLLAKGILHSSVPLCLARGFQDMLQRRQAGGHWNVLVKSSFETCRSSHILAVRAASQIRLPSSPSWPWSKNRMLSLNSAAHLRAHNEFNEAPQTACLPGELPAEVCRSVQRLPQDFSDILRTRHCSDELKNGVLFFRAEPKPIHALDGFLLFITIQPFEGQTQDSSTERPRTCQHRQLQVCLCTPVKLGEPF